MFQNYLTTAIRHLLHNKLFSIVNIFGLAVGVMACSLIMLFVRNEYSYDKFWKDADQIHRLQMTVNLPGREPIVSVRGPGQSKFGLEAYFAEEIETVGRFYPHRLLMRNGENTFSQRVVWVDPEIADIFSFDIVEGDIHATFNDASSIAVSESFANQQFGEGSALGKTLTLTVFETVRDYQVAAVYKDIPQNSVLDLPIMAPVTEQDFASRRYIYASWFSVNTFVYFKLKEGVSIDAINSRLEQFMHEYMQNPPHLPPDAKLADIYKPNTLALTDAQLNSPGNREMKVTGSKMMVMVFAAIAGLILLIACINFMNLSTAKSTKRAREVALRKVLGAKRTQLVVQFLGETILLAFIGFLLGLVFAELAVPFYSDFIGKNLAIDYADSSVIAIFVGLFAFIGIVGGAYPALILSGYFPAKVLKSNQSDESGGSIMLRNALVVLQFTISIALIACTATVYSQMKYATEMDPGFNRDNFLMVKGIAQRGARDQQTALKQEIMRLPDVTSAALISDRPSSGRFFNTRVTMPDIGSDEFIVGVLRVDHEFLDAFGVDLLAGRNYSRDYVSDGTPSREGLSAGDIRPGTILINEAAVSRFGFSSVQESIGETIRYNIGSMSAPIYADLEIIGVMPSLKWKGLREKIDPFMYPLDMWRYREVAVRYTGDPIELVNNIKNLWSEFVPDVPFSYEFVDDALRQDFDEEQNIAVALAAFSLLAVVVACLGLYGVATFTAERRTKEIGIRKVLGASVRDIVQLLLWQFSKPVLLANLIAWPIAVWTMMRWLETFPYRLDDWQILPLCLAAGLLSLLIAWLTVGGNAAKVARTNPIKALRCE